MGWMPLSEVSPPPVHLTYRIVEDGERNGVEIVASNADSKGTEIKLSKLLLNLHEPLEALPIEWKLKPGEQETRTLHYPRDAWAKAERGVNYQVFSPSGSSEVNTVAEPSPAFGGSPNGPLSVGLLDWEPGPLEVRVISVLLHGKEQLSKPIQVTVAPGQDVAVAGIEWAEGLVVKYGYRLTWNKGWVIGSMKLGS